MAEPAEKIQKVLLETADFEKALAAFVDETKPDPLVQRQLESWSMEWTNSNISCGNDNDNDNDSTTDKSAENTNTSSLAVGFTPTHVLAGNLVIRRRSEEDQLLQVTLQSTCWWRQQQQQQQQDSSSTTTAAAADEGQLVYECKAYANFVKIKTNDKKEKKRKEKMQERLQKDDYVQKLLVSGNENQERAAMTMNPPPTCCVARIYQSPPNELEERVDCHEDIGEGIRRAIFSSADSALDVFEVLVNLPFLPTTHHALARRAKLRLLEDAMCNACEQQGEEELVSDLDLKDGDEQGVQQQKQKRSRKG